MTTEQEALKPCLIAGDCKHGNWCSDVYCQEHCRFVKDLDALDALAELLDEAKGGWDLPPSATARIGAITRKSAAMLRKLVAEREADRAAMREALEALEQATTGWSKPSEKWLHVSEEAIPVADAAITHLRQRLEGTT